jgi:hypothetical protein
MLETFIFKFDKTLFMPNGPKKRIRASSTEPEKSDDFFDPAIWKDKQDILQTLHISDSTLARYRKAGVRFKQFGKKCFYDIRDVDRLYKEMRGKKEKQLKWPISWLWTAVWAIEPIILFTSKNGIVAAFTMAIPLTIAIPADIIIRIRKHRDKK